MPIPTPGAATFPATITIPAGADPQTRASIATPLAELADRTAYLRRNAEPSNALPHRFRFSALHCSFRDGSWEAEYGTHGPEHLIAPSYDSTRTFASLDLVSLLPSGATITRVRALVQQATASPTLRMALYVRQGTMPFETPAAPVWTSIASVLASASAGVQVLDTGELATPIPVVRSTPLTEHPQRCVVVSVGQESAPNSRLFGFEVFASLPTVSNR